MIRVIRGKQEVLQKVKGGRWDFWLEGEEGFTKAVLEVWVVLRCVWMREAQKGDPAGGRTQKRLRGGKRRNICLT